MTALSVHIGARPAPGTVTGRDGRQLNTGALAEAAAADDLAGAKVALCLSEPLDLITMLATLDGVASELLLLSYALSPEIVEELTARAGSDVIVSRRDDLGAARPVRTPEACQGAMRPDPDRTTRWLMTTSGTTGTPKIIPHSLASLARSISRLPTPQPPVWGLLYEPTRFAGLQVALQALIGGGDLVAVDTSQPLGDQVATLVRAGCTYLSSTPTLWRRLLMTPGHRDIPLVQATLGGEIADQSTLNALAAAYPETRITHIYASTEAGVGFSVTDGKAGFPDAYLNMALRGVRMKIIDDILWLRPPVSSLISGTAGVEVDGDGYVRSGDLVRHEDGRVLFQGRDSGLINIGGVKVYPETVEAVVQSVPGVALAQISAKKSPVTGALVVADVQLSEGADKATVKAAIREACAAKLEREAMPAVIRFVEAFTTNTAGKLVRKKA